MSGVLERLRPANVARMARWHGPGTDPWTGADWSNAMCGEAGEAANVVKKLRRHETGLGHSHNTPPQATLHAALARELADVIIYTDLLAHHYKIDLAAAIVTKFNETSDAQGFPERLAPPVARTVSYAPIGDMVTDGPELAQPLRASCEGCGRTTGEYCVCYARSLPCTQPPDGWSCSRPRGHEGPCAATPVQPK